MILPIVPEVTIETSSEVIRIQSSGSHDSQPKSRDSQSELHDSHLKSHDAQPRSHDAQPGSHDLNTESHITEPGSNLESYDSHPKSHVSHSGSHDSQPESGDSGVTEGSGACRVVEMDRIEEEVKRLASRCRDRCRLLSCNIPGSPRSTVRWVAPSEDGSAPNGDGSGVRLNSLDVRRRVPSNEMM